MFSATIIGLIIVALIIWFWQSNMKSHEIALQYAKQLCKIQQVQLLDATVAMKGFRFKRQEDGRMAFKRTYTFEYTDSNTKRMRGRIVVHGFDVTEGSLQVVDGASVENHVRLESSDKPAEPGQVIDFKKFQQAKNDEEK